MQFSDVIAQYPVKQQLINMVQQNRLSHAQLFLGKEGTGGLALALAFAQYVVCDTVNGRVAKSKQNDFSTSLLFDEPAEILEIDKSKACGICAACKKAKELVHPDIHFSYPIFPRKAGDKPVCTDFIEKWREFVKSNPYGNMYDWLLHADAENKQGNINVYECENILHKMSLKSFESEYKILIMWMPEALGKEGNKLLKLIEEPPPNTLFVFVAENESMLLQTIISRTQLVKLAPLQPEEIAGALMSRENISENIAMQTAILAEGNYREAVLQLQHSDENRETMLREWLNAILRSGPVAQTNWVDNISKIGRESQKQFLKYFTHLIQQCIYARLKQSANNAPASDFALRLNKICGIEQQMAIVKELDLAGYHIERNANAKILFHALTIKLYHIISNNSVILMH